MVAPVVCTVALFGGCAEGGSSTDAPTSTKPIPVQSARQAVRRGEPKLLPPKGPPPQDLVVKDLVEGSGPVAKKGDELTVEYVGVHYNGAPFTNSWERRKPFHLKLGANSPMVNPGWEKGIPGMRLGGRRELIVPPDLLFQSGAPPESRPADALVYVIDLVALH